MSQSGITTQVDVYTCQKQQDAEQKLWMPLPVFRKFGELAESLGLYAEYEKWNN
jgi:hypothetical protein